MEYPMMTLITGGQHVGYPLVDQPGLFAAGNHVDWKAENFIGAPQKSFPVACLAQCLGGDRPHLPRREARQALAEAGQAVPAALHGLRAEVAFTVHSGALANGFLEVFGAFELAVIQSNDFEPKTVGAEVDRRKACSVLHG